MTEAQLDQDLFDYQKEGWRFLASKKYALLADEMGLGKTVQAIRALNKEGAKHNLIVAPSVALHNWEMEIGQWSYQDMDPFVARKLTDRPKPGQTLICSFDFMAANYEKLDLNFDAVVVDEAHFLKSPTAKRARAILSKKGAVHKAKRTWFLTGTPMPNNPSELWIMLYVFGVTDLSYDNFVAKFCLTKDTPRGLKIIGADRFQIPELKKMLSQIMLRRLKRDVMEKLPPLKHIIKGVEPGLVDFSNAATFGEYFYPVPQRQDLFERIEKEQKLIESVFENTKSPHGKVTALASIADSVGAARRYAGLQKVEPTVEMICNAHDWGHWDKAVVFAYHADVIEALKRELKRFKPVVIYGRTNPKTRVKNLRKFKENKGCKIFIGQILAAGTAINLTNASDIYIVEQDWVPGNNAQAIMRCHRIGQNKKVLVRWIGLKNSIDQRLSHILKKKTDDLTAILDE